MTLFWLAAAVLAIVALAIALPSFLFPPNPAADNSRRENIAAAKARLQELQKSELPKTEADEYETEIKTLLLAETEKSAADSAPRARADKTGALLVCLVLLCGAPPLYFHLGAPHIASAPPLPDLTAAIAGLKQHIADNPDDVEALMLLARTLVALGREKEAEEYFARAAAADKSEN